MPGQDLRNKFWSRICCWMFLAAVMLSGERTLAQDRPRQPLEFEVDQGRWALRSGAPVPLRLKVICSSPGILEGQLTILAWDNLGSLIASIQIPDLVYSTGRQDVEYLLPIQSHSMAPPLKIECRFQAKQGGEYVSQGLLIPPQKRAFVVPIVRLGEPEPGSDDYSWLALESHCPKHSTESTFTPMLTQLLRVDPVDLPRDPLKHMPHDLVVLESSGLTHLQGPQVHALEAWVRAGGSLFLQLGSTNLSQEQQSFVDRLVATNPSVLSDEVDGKSLVPVIASGRYASLDIGFGHVLLTTERSWGSVTEADRRHVFAFLWRLRPEQSVALEKTGQLTLELVARESQQDWAIYQGQLRNTGDTSQIPETRFGLDALIRHWERILQTPHSSRPNEMIEALMPRDVEAVPIWLIGSIILIYIAAIGFGDYIILGRLKRRRWTWFTFPAVTLLISLLSIGTAQSFLSSSQELSVVEYRDVADDGMIARIQRFELHFRSSPGSQTTELDQSIFTPVAQQSTGMINSGRPSASTETQVVSIRGVPTQQATAYQQLSQWRPQLNRTMSIPRNREAPLRLVAPPAGVATHSSQFQKHLSDQIITAFPEVLGVLFYAETGSTQMSISPDWNSFSDIQLCGNCQIPNSATSPQSSSGMFTLFQQISPSADTGLADLVIASPEHVVVCAIVKESTGQRVVYRWKLKSNP